MILCVTYETASHFKNALLSQHRLRYQSCIKRQNWEVPTINEMEYDNFDSKATTYLIWIDPKDGEAKGCSRLIRTDRPYMIQTIWPDLVQTISLPSSPKILEGSRFCVDKHMAPHHRRRIIGELICAYLEYGLIEGIESIIGVMTPFIWKSVFCRSGWPVEFIGSEKQLDNGDKVVAGMMTVDVNTLIDVRQKMGIKKPVLRMAPSAFRPIPEKVIQKTMAALLGANIPARRPRLFLRSRG